jgi:hypothetical protein
MALSLDEWSSDEEWGNYLTKSLPKESKLKEEDFHVDTYCVDSLSEEESLELIHKTEVLENIRLLLLTLYPEGVDLHSFIKYSLTSNYKLAFGLEPMYDNDIPWETVFKSQACYFRIKQNGRRIHGYRYMNKTNYNSKIMENVLKHIFYDDESVSIKKRKMIL